MDTNTEHRWAASAKKVFSKTKRATDAITTNPAPRLDWSDSVGTPEPNIGVESCWQVQGPALEAWNEMHPKIKQFLNKRSEPLADSSVLWIIRMIGASPTTAIPTIIFCCEDAVLCKQTWKAVKESDTLKDFPGVRLARLPRSPTTTDKLVAMADHQSRGENIGLDTPRVRGRHTPINFPRVSYRRRARSSTLASGPGNTSPALDSDSDEEAHLSRYMDVIERPAGITRAFGIIGSSIQITPGYLLQLRSVSNPECVTEATIGGAISVNTKLFLMTAGHPFRTKQPTKVSTGQMENVLQYSDSDDDGYDPQTVQSDRVDGHTAATLPSFRVLKSNETQSAAEHPSSDLEHRMSNSSVESTEQNPPSSTPNQAVAEQFSIGTLRFICEEESSGDLDYALIEIARDSIYHGTVVDIDDDSDSKFTDQNAFRNHLPKYVHSMIASTPEHKLNGQISSAAAFIRLPHARVYQEVYEVKFDKSLQVGDCGSWVKDTASGKIHGHIIAGSPRDGIAYIVPFYRVMEDLRAALKDPRYHAANVPTYSPIYDYTDQRLSRYHRSNQSRPEYGLDDRYEVHRSWQTGNREVYEVLETPVILEAISRLEGRSQQDLSTASRPRQSRPSPRSPYEPSFPSNQGGSRPLGYANLRSLNESRSPNRPLERKLREDHRSGPYDAIQSVARRSD